jgi:hypothetical protein
LLEEGLVVIRRCKISGLGHTTSVGDFDATRRRAIEFYGFTGVLEGTDLLAIAGSGIRWTNVVKEQCGLLEDMESDIHEEYFINIPEDLYRGVATTHVETFCLKILRILEISWAAVSGCRANKFSIHNVSNRVLTDRPCASMKLLVYEIARSFAVED